MPAQPRHRRRRQGRRRALVVAAAAALWAGAAAATAALALGRYDGVARRKPGPDFGFFLHAAQSVAQGISPYHRVGGYVYPPFVALALQPFARVDKTVLWEWWLALIVLVPIAGVAAFAVLASRRVPPLLLPVLVTFCSFTLLWPHLWPFSRDLDLGQTDTMLFPFVVLAALAADRGRSVLRGVAIGLGGLLKGWPLMIGLSLFQRRLRRRWRAIVSVMVTSTAAPIVAYALWGSAGVTGYLRNAFDARRQPELINDCVWGIPRLLFAQSGLARPVTVSGPLRVAVTALLAAWVLVLLAAALWTKGEPALCTWNVTFCALLLLPISHRQYAVLVLPLVWWWAARLLQPGRRRPLDGLVFAVLLGWWLVQSVFWPYTFSAHTISALRYSVPFTADLLACTASAVGARWVARTAAAATEAAAADEGAPDGEPPWPTEALQPVAAGS